MSSKSSNSLVNPNARDAMNRFKMEAAGEVGVNLKQMGRLFLVRGARNVYSSCLQFEEFLISYCAPHAERGILWADT